MVKWTIYFLGMSAMLTIEAHAQDLQLQDWSVGYTKSRDYVYAVTTNDSGSLLGEYCSVSTGTCVWLLGMATSCDQGNKYPVLENSSSGADQLEVYCDGVYDANLYRYAFSKFDSIAEAVKNGSGLVGFAFPMKEGQFKVSRFSLNGANAAVSTMEKLAVKSAAQKTRGKDENL